MSKTRTPERARALRRFKPYPAYKDSGVEWLGEIPAHWEVKPLKAILSRNDSGVWGEDSDESGVIVLRSTEQTVDGDWDIADPARRKLTARERSAAKLEVDDLVVTKSSGSELHIGKTSIVNEQVAALECCYSNFMQRLRIAPRNSPRLFWRLLNCPVAREQLVFLSSTTTGLGNLNGSILGAIRVPLSPEPEQHAIVAFLDRETARIDAMVAKKERLIELLQEKRTALVTRAVTKGLDTTVPKKDSGVEWLGEIPAHWEVLSIGRVIRGIEQGWSPVAEDRQAGPDEWGVIKLSAVARGAFVAAEHKALPNDLAPDVRYEIRDGDFLLTRSNTPELVGDVCVVRRPPPRLMLCDLVYRLDLRPDAVVPGYLSYWLLSPTGRYQIEVEARGASHSMVKVSQGLIRSWAVLVPPTAEQQTIAAFLDRETARLDALITKVRDAIARIKELRTALISAAVTGKIDVREEAA